jgi:hypothetical protein
MEAITNRNVEEDLENINQPRFRQLVKSESSIDVAFNDFRNRTLFKVRKSHFLDCGLPVILIIASLVIAIVFTMKRQDIKVEDKISSSSAMFGVSVAVLSFLHSSHKSRHDRQLDKASDYVKRWNVNLAGQRSVANEYKKPILDPYRYQNFNPDQFNLLRNSLADFKSSPNRIHALAQLQTQVLQDLSSPKRESIRKDFNDILNFFESMGQDIKLGVADSDYLKEYFYSIVIDTYQLARKYIEYNQYKRGSRGVWCNLTFLAHTWEKENVPPEIPAICIRPLVITKEDVEAAEKNGFT